MYHFDAARTGWSDVETTLTPARVGNGLRRAWTSPALDTATLAVPNADGGTARVTFPPRLFGAPLYFDDLPVNAPPLLGRATSVVLAATTNGWIYAIAAVDTQAAGSVVTAGSILWRTQLGVAAYVPGMDHGTPLGVLSTPIVDRGATPPTVYVTAIDATAGWQAWALDATSGAVLSGWPIAMDPATVASVNVNVLPDGGSGAAMSAPIVQSQRAALALASGKLYVGFGAYYDGGIGWMVAIDLSTHKVAASFSGSQTNPVPPAGDDNNAASAGMWGAGGPALASDGRIYVTTGNSPSDDVGAPGVWGNSLLAFNPDLSLAATYSPFNYCLMDLGDTDLAGSSPIVFDVDPSLTATPRLATFGGKQGVVYLVDRDHLGGSLVARPACDLDAGSGVPSGDNSLYGGALLDQYSPPSRGPLSVFGPYSDQPGDNAVDHAKMRTTPALFRPASGGIFVYFTGTSRDPSNLEVAVPPCMARTRVNLSPGAPAYLSLDAVNDAVTFVNPGSPIVTSHDGGADAVVWVLDQNAQRSDPLVPQTGYAPPNAVLYAFDATTMAALWQSDPGDLGPSAKYGHVVVAHGVVYAGTDRIAAFVPQ
jgi:hypothetical protein